MLKCLNYFFSVALIANMSFAADIIGIFEDNNLFPAASSKDDIERIYLEYRQIANPENLRDGDIEYLREHSLSIQIRFEGLRGTPLLEQPAQLLHCRYLLALDSFEFLEYLNSYPTDIHQDPLSQEPLARNVNQKEQPSFHLKEVIFNSSLFLNLDENGRNRLYKQFVVRLHPDKLTPADINYLGSKAEALKAKFGNVLGTNDNFMSYGFILLHYRKDFPYAEELPGSNFFSAHSTNSQRRNQTRNGADAQKSVEEILREAEAALKREEARTVDAKITEYHQGATIKGIKDFLNAQHVISFVLESYLALADKESHNYIDFAVFFKDLYKILASHDQLHCIKSELFFNYFALHDPVYFASIIFKISSIYRLDRNSLFTRLEQSVPNGSKERRQIMKYRLGYGVIDSLGIAIFFTK